MLKSNDRYHKKILQDAIKDLFYFQPNTNPGPTLASNSWASFQVFLRAEEKKGAGAYSDYLSGKHFSPRINDRLYR
jgi:hypothetical protein